MTLASTREPQPLPRRSAPTAAAVNCHFTADFITM